MHFHQINCKQNLLATLYLNFLSLLLQQFPVSKTAKLSPTNPFSSAR